MDILFFYSGRAEEEEGEEGRNRWQFAGTSSSLVAEPDSIHRDCGNVD